MASKLQSQGRENSKWSFKRTSSLSERSGDANANTGAGANANAGEGAKDTGNQANLSVSGGTGNDSSKSALDWMKKKLFGLKSKESSSSSTSPSSNIDDLKKGQSSLSTLSTASSTSLSLASQSLASVDSLQDTKPIVSLPSNVKDIRERRVLHQQMSLELITLISHEFDMETSKCDLSVPLSSATQLFCSQRAPSIPIHLYIHRLVSGINKVYDNADKNATEMNGTGMRCLMTAMIYLKRLRKLNEKLEINPLNVHRLILASFMCALKFSEDEIPSTSFLTMLGGVSAEQFIICESRFIKQMNYELRVDFEEIKKTFEGYCIPNHIDYKLESPTWSL